MARVIWTTDGFPVNNDGQDDARPRQVGTTLPGGTVFRVVEFGPGVQPRNHRTDSIDYAIVMSGEIDMEMDGTMVHLKAGDVLVQRGTIHNWINNGTEPCVIAFVLIDAKPVEAQRQGAQRGGLARTIGSCMPGIGPGMQRWRRLTALATSPASRSLRPRTAHRAAPAPARRSWCWPAAAPC